MQTLKEYKCENVFRQKTDCMKHRKQDHTQFVPECRDTVNGACRYEKNGCLYIHEDTKDSPHEESSSMMNRLFERMEKLTERMLLIDNQLYN